ncbi:putative quinol monooxygenase [Pseudonocardia humida]|uniref:Antibiotic biosynthesis monooxygenase n=1 Tax=Pseudonocardia humida TaxID=2800819 RepID=A0ABT0ZU31_9PSEU|nr:antibiotic biosynthesis monooxygenase family protein [Pseudonocardia humida]MCO1654232.1 antibiotic biosynthesis monooxygenase [Pseudonocardia humida]
MLIIAGHLAVDPAERDAYVADCRPVVELAREAPGCRDFALTADSVDPGRIDVYERWDTEAELEAFRGSGPDAGTAARILDAEVSRYVIASVGPA